MTSGGFGVTNCTSIVFQNSVHVEVIFTIRPQRVVMSVEQKGGPGGEAGRHEGGILGIELDKDETVPGGTVAVNFGLELAEEGLFELSMPRTWSAVIRGRVAAEEGSVRRTFSNSSGLGAGWRHAG
jgi:hypothetical protein